jgi:hypothetical protein
MGENRDEAYLSQCDGMNDHGFMALLATTGHIKDKREETPGK